MPDMAALFAHFIYSPAKSQSQNHQDDDRGGQDSTALFFGGFADVVCKLSRCDIEGGERQ